MKKPNIVYILADDMGYGDLSCLNSDSKIRTVNLDRMAAEGLRFTDAHSSSAVCTPSRYSILTGRYNWRSSLKENVLYGYRSRADFYYLPQNESTDKTAVLNKNDFSLIEPGRMTAASYLKKYGYHTACIGKWHLGWNWGRKDNEPEEIDFAKPISDGPVSRGGFDYFFGIAGSLDMSPYVYVENETLQGVPDHITKGPAGKGFWSEGPTAPGFVHENVHDEITERACDYIKQQAERSQPFFLYFPLTAPHGPILPTKEYLGKSGTNEYGDFCLMVDGCVGKIMQTLKAAGVDENTILIFTSDNGCSPTANFQELADCGHNPSYHFRGHKADIYEGGHRIPLLIRWPDQIKADVESEETVCLCDFLATIADWFGDKLPDNAAEDSVSNLDVWLSKDSPAPLREATVHHSIDGSFSIRQGKWKLEFCAGSGGWSYPSPQEVTPDMPKIQLYDLDCDISERSNVYDQHPEMVEKLTKLMTQYVHEGRSTSGKRQSNTGPKYWPQLNWLSENDLF